MKYETTVQAAQRLGVSSRTICKWARENRIPGALRQGRSWLIPSDFAPDDRLGHIVLPLMNSAYPVGRCREFIESIPDADDRAIAWGEYYYYSGQARKAAEAMSAYQDSADPMLRHSANLVSFFANFARGETRLAMRAFERLMADLHEKQPSGPKTRAIGAMVATTASVLLHLPVQGGVALMQCIARLPNGLKMWSCYLLAHGAYLEKNYNGSLAIAELVSLKRVEEALTHIDQAWALARPDDLIEPFGEHHGLLQGLIERFFQKDAPEMFDRIIAITYAFSAGWRRIHNPAARHDVADNLTTTEFTIAMLYNRGWTAKEIAAYMNLSPRTITNAIQVIYQKLGISGKRELGQFMLT